MRLLLIATIFLFTYWTTNAQSATPSAASTLGVQFSYWGTFKLDASVPVRTKKEEVPLRFVLGIEDRRLGFPDKQHHFLLSGQFIRPIELNDKLTISPIIGYIFFLGQNANLSDQNDPQVPENRPFQGLELKRKFDKLSFSSRVIVEERWIRNANQFERLPGSLFFLRLRFQVRADITLYKPDDTDRKLFLFIFDEVMPQFGKNQAQVFDQNRFSVGLTYATTKPLSISVGYLVWYQEMPNGVQRWLRHISTLSLTYHIK